MSDQIIRATAANGAVRAFVANSKETVETARQLHHTSPVATAALGRLLTAAAIMGCDLKGEKDLVTLQIKGDGPLGGIVATADSQSRVKGYTYQNDVELMEQYKGKLDIGRAVGQGTLTVIKDIGLKEPYAGQLPLQSGEIAQDLTYYFAQSEQTPSAVALGVLVDVDGSVRQAGGFLVQLLPDAPEEIISQLEQNIAKLPNFTDLLDLGKSIQEILSLVLDGLEEEILDEREMSWYCNCSRQRVAKALVSLGKEELTKLIEEDGKAEVKCHFCEKTYSFEKPELEEILQTALKKE